MSIYDAIAAITDRSRRGYASQMLFRAEAAARGFVPSTPEWNLSMDHILIDADHPHRLVRVEVKQSAQPSKSGGYVVELRGSQGPGGAAGAKKGKERLHEYEKSVDLIAIYLPLAKVWYLVPEAELRGRSSVTLKPDDDDFRLAKYKECWSLIDRSMHAVGDAATEQEHS
jgi:hypothetical protein